MPALGHRRGVRAARRLRRQAPGAGPGAESGAGKPRPDAAGDGAQIGGAGGCRSPETNQGAAPDTRAAGLCSRRNAYDESVEKQAHSGGMPGMGAGHGGAPLVVGIATETERRGAACGEIQMAQGPQAATARRMGAVNVDSLTRSHSPYPVTSAFGGSRCSGDGSADPTASSLRRSARPRRGRSVGGLV